MENLTKILVGNDKLQTAVDHFIDEIKEQFSIDLDTNIVSDEKMAEINEFSSEVFNEYNVYDDDLYDLAKDLNQQGYNFLEDAFEFEQKSILIVNETLRKYVFDKVVEHQELMKKSFEKDSQQISQLNFERE